MLEGVEGVKTSGAETVVTERWTHLFVDVLNVTLRQGRLSAVVVSGRGEVDPESWSRLGVGVVTLGSDPLVARFHRASDESDRSDRSDGSIGLRTEG